VERLPISEFAANREPRKAKPTLQLGHGVAYIANRRADASSPSDMNPGTVQTLLAKEEMFLRPA
jgi:hypothetical protein